MRRNDAILLSDAERRSLEGWMAERGPRHRLRASIVLLDSEGVGVAEIAKRLGIGVLTVQKWRRRWMDGGPRALDDRPRPGQPKKLDDEREKALLRRSLHSVPSGAIAWSIRRLAKVERVTEYQVRVTWERARLDGVRIQRAIREGHLVGARAPMVLGVIMDAPFHALVLEGGDPSNEADAIEGVDIAACMRSLAARRNEPGSLYAVADRLAGTVPDEEREARFLDALESLVASASSRPVTILVTPGTPLGGASRGRPELAGEGIETRPLTTTDAWLAAVESFLPSLERCWTPHARPSIHRLRTAAEAFSSAGHGSGPTNEAFVWNGTARTSYVRELDPAASVNAMMARPAD